MERERWMNRPRGARHVWVNLADFHAIIMDDDVPTFVTRSVIGARSSDRQSPEFSDVMEFMVINPSWYVPRSIVTKEYLPMLQRNPNAVSHIEITDSRGRRINRGAVDFSQFDRRTFPFSMRQPPSRGNALGLVKFMFPNRYNIYLHDTPQKSLFSRQTRTFSHGCIRLNDPFRVRLYPAGAANERPRRFLSQPPGHRPRDPRRSRDARAGAYRLPHGLHPYDRAVELSRGCLWARRQDLACAG